MRLFNITLIAAIAFVMTACHTMYFDRGSRQVSHPEHSEWHHDGILRLVEFSDPVNLAQRCGGRNWNTVEVERTFLNWLAGAFTFGLYDPWTVEYACEGEKKKRRRRRRRRG